MNTKNKSTELDNTDKKIHMFDVISSDLSDGYYWVKLKDDNIIKSSKFLQNSDGWLIGYYMDTYILVNGLPYKLEKFEVGKKIVR